MSTEVVEPTDTEEEEDRDEVVDASDDDEAVDDAPVEERPARRRNSNVPLRIAIGAAIVFGLLAVVLAAVAVSERNHGASDSDRTAVSATAAQVSQAIVTVSNDNKQTSDTIRQLATAPVSQQYDETASAIQKTMAPLNVSGYKGDIKSVYIGDIDPDQAKAIVVLDLIVLANPPKVVPNHYLDVHLSKIDGVWKVDNLQDINLALAAGGTSGGVVGGPSTTVPASTSDSTPPSSDPTAPSTSAPAG